MNQKSESVNIPKILATGSLKMDEIREKRLMPMANNLFTYFQINKGARLTWPDVVKILMKDGAQRKDLKNARDFVRLFPVFLMTDAAGNPNPSSKRVYLTIPPEQENMEGDADDIAVGRPKGKRHLAGRYRLRRQKRAGV